MKTQLLIPAAGMGVRLNGDRPKALTEVAGKPMLVRTLERFVPLGLATGAVIVVPPGHRDRCGEALFEAFGTMDQVLVDGGAQRQASVANGLAAIPPDTDRIVIHDAARPFVARDTILGCLEAAAECGAASAAIPCVDTILEADANNYLTDTPDRARLWLCQTPQTFRTDVILEAHARAADTGVVGTDDASLVRRLGGTVKLVTGTALNFKITTPTDLALAEYVVRAGLA